MPASGLRPAIFNLLEYFPNLWTKLPPYYFYNPALIWQTKNIPLYTEESDTYVHHYKQPMSHKFTWSFEEMKHWSVQI